MLQATSPGCASTKQQPIRAHAGLLYSRTGTLLAQASFTSETASGWQQVNFPGVAICANTTYIVALHSTTGYSEQRFLHQQRSRQSAIARIESGVEGPNRVFTYANFPLFPTSPSAQDYNYWVDELFAAN